jgi:hypothetical protein
MTAQASLASTSITNLNASPRVRPTAGFGGAAKLHSMVDVLPAMTTGATAGGVLRVIRVPANAVIKAVYWQVRATVTTLDCDVGCYYSNTSDGTGAVNVAAAATAIDADFFASAVDMKTKAAGWTECTFESAVYNTSMTNTTLWANLGLTGQPNGYIDICFTNTSTTDGAPILAMRVDYEMPS